ncbi:MAG: 4Fe-4S dicluster domain-containing protein [Bdellovibrionaceae bacterium]|nr:4Fe-4S dicluster domain-containing protein [Pseudobdellovibrionaceae bacterium]
MAKSFRPIDFQTPLDLNRLIIKNSPRHDEQVPMDVLFVGAGPAGLAGAIELARLVKQDNENGGGIGEVEIGVLEKAESLGGHNLSGAVINPRVLKDLFPELKEEDFPFRGKVKGDRFYKLTESGHVRLPTPPTMNNHGNYVASICEVVRWMGEKAEELGVNLFNSFPAEALLLEEDHVIGVRTTPMGLNKDGSPGSQYMPPTEVTAKITVLSEGTRGLLTQAYLQEQKISSNYPQIYALGVKEIWQSKNVPEFVTHTLDWPVPKSAFGGSFMYPMGEDLVAIGLVVGLDYKEHNLDVHKMLQQMKQHPLFKPHLDGGECLEWGAKTIPEGGLNALPESLHGNGLLMAGDCAGFVNVPALKGIHYAMQTGVYAARTAFKALKAQKYDSATLSEYDQTIKDSYIWSDLKKVRNMRQAFKSGFITGGIKAGLMTLTGGAFPGDGQHFEEDAAEEKSVNDSTAMENPGISKVDAVYMSANKTRDDIPSHLTVGKNIPSEVAEFYANMCPAGVYERQGDKLIVNAPNCVDCKATDVLGPRWQPREGGAGPNYRKM